MGSKHSRRDLLRGRRCGGTAAAALSSRSLGKHLLQLGFSVYCRVAMIDELKAVIVESFGRIKHADFCDVVGRAVCTNYIESDR